jgi:hypothetical protein
VKKPLYLAGVISSAINAQPSSSLIDILRLTFPICMGISKMFLKYGVFILLPIVAIYFLTTSTNLVYGASIFTVQPPPGWSYQEN